MTDGADWAGPERCNKGGRPSPSSLVAVDARRFVGASDASVRRTGQVCSVSRPTRLSLVTDGDLVLWVVPDVPDVPADRSEASDRRMLGSVVGWLWLWLGGLARCVAVDGRKRRTMPMVRSCVGLRPITSVDHEKL